MLNLLFGLFGKGTNNHQLHYPEKLKKATKEKLMRLPVMQLTQKHLKELPEYTGEAFSSCYPGTLFRRANLRKR